MAGKNAKMSEKEQEQEEEESYFYRRGLHSIEL